MKKLFGLMAMLLVAMTFVSCGDDKDEPDQPKINGIYSVLSGNATNYETTTESFYKFDVLGTSGRYIEMHNVKFDSRMPITITMRVPLSDCSRYVVNDSYTFDGQSISITPDLYRGGTWTPYSERPITKLLVHFDTKKKTYDIKFDCSGITVSGEGTLYIN